MKKGCFLKAIFLLILLIGVGYHFYKKYGRDFLEESKDKLISLAYENLLDEIKHIPASDYADSLKFILTEKFERLQNESAEKSHKEFNKVINSIGDFLDDSKLELEEYIQIKKILEDYERSEKVGN